jgi:CHAT domain-containing protein/tetratricopeptide (TPR) repeat protein
MVVVWVAVVLLSGCKTVESGPPAISLEQAKKVTATFEWQSFTPPPKSIDDITAILDDHQLVDPKAVERARARATTEPAPGISGIDLAEFFWNRGLAARKIGDSRQYLADLREAERLSRDMDGDSRFDILWDLSNAELLSGRFADAIHHREQSLAFVPSNRRGSQIARGAVLAVHYGRAGDLLAAEQLLKRSEALLAQAKSWRSWHEWNNLWTAQIARAKANLLDVKGQYANAEQHYRAAIVKFRKDFETHPEATYSAIHIELSHAELAENLLRQDRLIEGEIEARKAVMESLSRVGRDSQDTALQLKTLVRVIGAQGRHAEAEQLARALTDIYRMTGAPRDSFQLALARAELAEALVNQERWTAANDVFESIKADLATDAVTFDQFFSREINWAVALVSSGRAADAEEVARLAWQHHQSSLGPKHYLTAEAHGVLAIALTKLGMQQQARDAFEASVPILLTHSRRSDAEGDNQSAKEKRLRLILEAYMDLLARFEHASVAREFDAMDETFRLAQFARGQSVQRALSANAARAAAGDVELARLVRLEQDAVKQIGALYGLLARAVSETTYRPSEAALEELRVRIDTLRDARAAFAEAIEARFPEYVALMNPKPAAIAAARASLRPGEALVVTYVGNDETYVWAVPKAGQVAFAAAPLGRERVAAVIGSLRRSLDPQAASLGDIPSFDVGLSHRLYRELLAPVTPGWQQAQSLLVVADGSLGQLPLSVLTTKPAPPAQERKPLFSEYRDIPWLVRSHAVTVLPSVSSLATLRKLPPAAPTRRAFAGFGDPWFSQAQAAEAEAEKPTQPAALASRGALEVRGLPVSLRTTPALEGVSSANLAMLPRLPDTGDEVKSIALALNADLSRDVFTGKAATEDRVKSITLSGYKVLAFATHGLVPGDLDGLTQPALALTSPQVAGGSEDGLLTMGEILGLRLDADWVVLSACNTAAGAGAGAEAVSGLGRAFFYAGTRALLVSNWPVETTSARALTTDLFRRQSADPTLSRAEALRRTMNALIDGPGFVDAQGRTVFSYAHPIFWAPFSLVGDAGGHAAGS